MYGLDSATRGQALTAGGLGLTLSKLKTTVGRLIATQNGPSPGSGQLQRDPRPREVREVGVVATGGHL